MGIMDIGSISLNPTHDSRGRLLTGAASGPGTGRPSVPLTYGYDTSGGVTCISDRGRERGKGSSLILGNGKGAISDIRRVGRRND